MKTKHAVFFAAMIVLAIIFALSVPAFEIVPKSYGIVSLAGFVILFAVFIKNVWRDDGQRR